MPTEPQINNALEVEDLHKAFGDNQVLNDISICTKEGEVWSGGSAKPTPKYDSTIAVK